jgi:hypothetical protein
VVLRGSCLCDGVRFEVDGDIERVGGWPSSEWTSVRLPALELPEEIRPQFHGFIRSVAAWETLPDDGLDRRA